MTKADKNDVRLMLQQEFKPIFVLLQRHEQTLFGPTGENGIEGDNKSNKKRLDFLEASRNRVMGAVGIVPVIVSGVMYFLINLFRSNK